MRPTMLKDLSMRTAEFSSPPRRSHGRVIAESVFSWERAISDYDVVADRLPGSSGVSKMRTIRGRSRGMSLSLQARWGIS